ncbi:hypothetical protein E2C06_32875 [Dankookia rubra]|uniref:O-methyltransferase dimerisation domain-containing protein n=1 Tax=Dankookia rubra TaxID=1442381 RepID=A0A4R5Q7Y6_9PROT|nr:hypothetical protein E2C06_32875 [Dankookia rubra]
MRLVNGCHASQAIHVVAALGITDLLRDRPRSIADRMAAVGVRPRSLCRLLRALAAVSVFREKVGQRFSLTPIARCPKSDVHRSVGLWAEYVERVRLRRKVLRASTPRPWSDLCGQRRFRRPLTILTSTGPPVSLRSHWAASRTARRASLA